MSLPNSKGQEQLEQSTYDCSQCQNPPDRNMTCCSECYKTFHKSCVEIVEDVPFQCLSCSAIRPNSPALSATSHFSIRTRNSNSKRLQLQLQKLEEERQFHKEYLDKKYKLLEADNNSDSSSVKLQCTEDWVNNASKESCADKTLTTSVTNDLSLNQMAYFTNVTSTAPTSQTKQNSNIGNQPAISNAVSCSNAINAPVCSTKSTNNIISQKVLANTFPLQNSIIPEQTNYFTCQNLSSNVNQSSVNYNDSVMQQDSYNFISHTASTNAVNSSYSMFAIPTCTVNSRNNQQPLRPFITGNHRGPTLTSFNTVNNNTLPLFNNNQEEFIHRQPDSSTQNLSLNGAPDTFTYPP